MEGQSVPYARASQLLQELLGVQLSAGSIATFVTTCHQQLAEVETRLKAALVKTNVIHQDETALRVGTTGWWVHVCSTDRLTHYAAHPNRGRKALDAIGIAPQFRGTSVHDGFLSYQGYRFTQALCNVHHVRELTFIEEELKQLWAKKMKELLLEMKAEVERAKALGQHELDALLLAHFLRRYDSILAEGYQANPPPAAPNKSEQSKRTPGRAKQSPARNLLDRLSGSKWAVLRFLLDFAVPFDNDLAAYCTLSAWLACFWIFVSTDLWGVFIGRREDRNPMIIGAIHGDQSRPSPIHDGLSAHSVGLRGFIGRQQAAFA